MNEYESLEQIGRDLIKVGFVDHTEVDGEEKVRINGKGVIAFELLRDLVDEARKK